MAKLSLDTQFGDIEQSKSVSFEIKEIKNPKGARLVVENATHQVPCLIEKFEQSYVYLSPGTDSFSSRLSVEIPEHSEQSAISLFATVETRNNDGDYEKSEITSAVFFLAEKQDPKFVGTVMLDPPFVGEDGFCKISVQHDPKDRIVAAVNGKRMAIFTDENGNGSISFKAKDVLDIQDATVVQKFPINVYLSVDRFTEPYSSGAYVHVLPGKIAAMEDCDAWEIPAVCLAEGTDVVGNVVNTLPLPPETSQPDIAADLGNIPSDCTIEEDGYSGLNDLSVAKLPNGMMMVAVVSAEKVLLTAQKTSSETAIVNPVSQAIQISSLELASETIVNIDITQDLYDSIVVGDSIVILHEQFDYGTFEIQNKHEILEDINIYRISVDPGSIDASTTLTCVPILIVDSGCDASITSISDLPAISTTDNSISPPVLTSGSAISASVAVDPNLHNSRRETLVYVVAQAAVSGVSQLFFYSIRTQVNVECDSLDIRLRPETTFGWVRLTGDGENKNPKVICDTAGTLHVFWESDRTGQNQIYYGALGPGAISRVNGALTTAFDKKAMLDQTSDKPFDYVTDDLVSLGTPAPISTRNMWGNAWSRYANFDGKVTTPHFDQVNIEGNALHDQAIAFTSFDQDETLHGFSGKYKQLSYQLSFNLKMNNDTAELSAVDIDNAYNNWRSQYIPKLDADRDNANVYESGENTFLVDRDDSYYDRIIPIAGSYKNDEAASFLQYNIQDTESQFIAKTAGADANVRHFILAIMPEKSRFIATNVLTETEFTASNPGGVYIEDDEMIMYTGRYKLALLINAKRYVGSPKEDDYSIVRQFATPFTLNELRNFKIMVHYSKMYREDASTMISGYTNQDNLCRYWGSIYVFVDDVGQLGESFLTDFSGQYRSFEIGLGFPGGGHHVTSRVLPYESNVYEEFAADMTFNAITISPVAMTFNNDVIRASTREIDFSSVVIADADDREEDNCVTYLYDSGNLVETVNNTEVMQKLRLDDFAFDADQFSQIPLTIEGVNKSVDVDTGMVGDVHIAWETNRSKYWDVCYSSSLWRNLPFRFDTQITNTKSNSIMPSVSISENGSRLVAWQDNRTGQYQVYMARATGGVDYAGGICETLPPACDFIFDFTNFGCVINEQSSSSSSSHTDVTSSSTSRSSVSTSSSSVELSYSTVVTSDSPLAYWRLGESSGTKADNAMGNSSYDGTYIGVGLGFAGAINADPDTAGNFHAASFSRVRIPILGDLGVSMGSGITFECWIKNPGPTGVSAIQYIFLARNTSTGTLFGVQVNQSTGGVSCTIRDNNLDDRIGVTVAGTNVMDNAWHHIVALYDNVQDKVFIWIDGSQNVTHQSHGGALDSFSNFTMNRITIGSTDAPGHAFGGAIDEVSIYDRVLTEDEISLHYGAAQ